MYSIPRSRESIDSGLTCKRSNDNLASLVKYAKRKRTVHKQRRLAFFAGKSNAPVVVWPEFSHGDDPPAGTAAGGGSGWPPFFLRRRSPFTWWKKGCANLGLIRAPITPSGGRTMSVSQKTVSVSWLEWYFLCGFTTKNREKGTMLIWAYLGGRTRCQMAYGKS